MMKNFLRLMLLLWALMGATLGTRAAIVLQEPVITDSYMKFVGENADNNYRFTLDTYEWADRGPQFRLTIERIDASQPAQFKGSDLSDPNHWEPMFRSYTKELAGEEMTAQDNVKKLYVKDVALLDGQFSDYENLHIIGIEAAGDFTLRDNMFKGCEKLDTLYCNVQGTLTLGTGVINNSSDFVVKVYTVQSRNLWTQYRTNNASHFTIDDSTVPVDNTPRILSVSGNVTVNNDVNQTQELPDAGGKTNLVGLITTFLLNGFTAQTSGNVTEVYMEYALNKDGETPQSSDWHRVHAAQTGEGTWQTSIEPINILAGLESNSSYRLEMGFYANSDNNVRSNYPTSGEHIVLKFTTGNLAGIQSLSAALLQGNAPLYDLQGRRVQGLPAKGGIYIKNGRKVLVK